MELLLAFDVAFAILDFMNTFSKYYRQMDPSEKIELAKRLNTSLAYLSQLAHGHRNPGGKILREIRSATDGSVTAETFSSPADTQDAA